MKKTDADIVRDILAGDKDAFKALLERHLAGVYAFSHRYMRDSADAEDVAQEAFVRAWKNLEKFDTSKNFKTWIFTIARNVALDVIKKKKPLLFSHISEEEEKLETFLAPYVSDTDLPDIAFDRAREKVGLGEAMGALPAAYQTILGMRYHDNLKFREIADALGEPIDTIKSRHRRGLSLLRKIIPENVADSGLA
jgi:RNA polymerase sigma-70 factor (ECF subfamily)